MRFIRLRKPLLSVALAGAIATTGCAAFFPAKTVEFETVPSDATLSIDGQYYGEGAASWTMTPGLPRTLHLRVEPPKGAPYEVSISNKGDYSLWWFTALYGAIGAGSLAMWSQHRNENGYLSLGATCLVLAPWPMLLNHKFENSYTLDAEHQRVVENGVQDRREARQATYEALQVLPTLRDVYVKLDDHYMRRVDAGKLALGALRGLLHASGHQDALPRFAAVAGDTPFASLQAAYRELGLSPFDRKLEYAAILGMVDALGDPLAAFDPPFTPRASASRSPAPSGAKAAYAEPGLLFDESQRRPIVKAVVTGSPAWKAGLKAGDELVALDGEALDGWRQHTIRQALYRPSGEKVTLRVRRDRTQELERTVTVQAVERPPLQTEEWGSDTLYFRLNGVGKALEPLSIALAAFADQNNVLIDLGKRNLVLDLRGPDASDFQSVAAIASLLSHDKRFGQVVGRHGRVLSDGRLSLLPRQRRLVVLVDGSTSGGHEILAGILQDQHRAVVIGTPTFGFCYSFLNWSYPDGSFLSFPMGEVLTPAKHRLSHGGVQPNVTVAPPAFDAAETIEDPLRQAARSLLLENLDAGQLEEKYRLPEPSPSPN